MNIQEWEFLNKGKANVVLRSVKDKNVVLRLRQKRLSSDTDYQSTLAISDYMNNIRCFLDDFMVSFKLHKVSKEFLLATNSWLKETYDVEVDVNENFGILMKNCLNIDNFHVHSTTKFAKLYENGADYVIEIKPKWLYLDLDSYYCRNCLTERLIRKTSSMKFCSLGLVSNDKETIEATITDIFNTFKFAHTNMQLFKEALLKYCCSDNNIFKALCHYENLGNNKNQILQLTSSQDISNELKLGMTLRDVTVFLSWNISSVGSLRAELLDIDPKSNNKWLKWKTDYEYLQSFKNFQDESWGPKCRI